MNSYMDKMTKKCKTNIKREDGMTALNMVVIVVILALLAGMAILTSRDALVEGSISKAYEEINVMRKAVGDLKALNEIDSDMYDFEKMFLNPPIDDISLYNSRVGGKLRTGEEYYYLGFGDESLTDVIKQTLADSLDVRGVENSYIVNVKDLDNIEVFLVGGIKIGDDYCYTYEEIMEARSSMFK